MERLHRFVPFAAIGALALFGNAALLSTRQGDSRTRLAVEVDHNMVSKHDFGNDNERKLSSLNSNSSKTSEAAMWVASGNINTFTSFLLPSDSSIYGLNTVENGLFLSDAITVRMLAVAGHSVPYADGSKSNDAFHPRPDGAQTFQDLRPDNPNGWIYVSNSEVTGSGGVGAVTFDQNGEPIDYTVLLTGTTFNCNGGKTHFGAWISCEEDFGRNGKAWQVDPTGKRAPQPISLGSNGGTFEAFACDVRDTSRPRFFLTEDRQDGPIYRWTPSNPDSSKPWEMLLGNGTQDYLLLSPDPSTPSVGTFSWTTDFTAAALNAQRNYPNTEGIDISGNTMFFVSKVTFFLFELNLDSGIYRRSSTKSGLFDGQPDTIRNILATDTGGAGGTMLYFTEDGCGRCGIHARDDEGNLYTLLESSVFQGETTGLAISPDGLRLYFCYQIDGILYEIRRRDGQSFRGTTLNLKSHPPKVIDEKRRRELRVYS